MTFSKIRFQVKVMHKQLVLLHNAVAAYFSGNAAALEGTIKQFNVKVSPLLSDALDYLTIFQIFAAKITEFRIRILA